MCTQSQGTKILIFITPNGYPDARVHLKNTIGYDKWIAGQRAYEKWEESGTFYNSDPSKYLEEIKRDEILYDRLSIEGSVLDVGGGIGTVREFLKIDTPFVSIDPFENLSVRTPEAKKLAYQCLNRPLEFVCGFAEFLPFKPGSFDVVHMRSMLDHVQVPDLALLEAGRVLNDNGKVIIGMTVEGGKPGIRIAYGELLKGMVKSNLARLGFERYRDHHTWHPTYDGLIELLALMDLVLPMSLAGGTL